MSKTNSFDSIQKSRQQKIEHLLVSWFQLSSNINKAQVMYFLANSVNQCGDHLLRDWFADIEIEYGPDGSTLKEDK